MTEAVKELIAAAKGIISIAPESSEHTDCDCKFCRLRAAVEAVKAEEKSHPFRSFYVTPWRALMGPCAVAFCGQPADAPIHQTGGKS